MKLNSIQARLVCYSTFVFSALTLLSGVFVLKVSTRAADEAYDRVLGAAALSISEAITVRDTYASVDLPYASFAILGTSGRNRIFYRIVNPKGELVTGNPVLGIDQNLLVEDQTRFFDSSYRGRAIRVAQVAQYHQGRAGGGWFNVFVGETREARDLLSRRIAGFALFPASVAILMAVALLVLAIRSSFRPLKRIEEMLKNRSPADLSPIKPGVPSEVEALVDAINNFMVRLEGALAGLRRLSADTAHQLRTPLAAMRAVSELALDGKPPPPHEGYVQRIHWNAVVASELVDQLMTEARLLHSMESGAVEPVDLVQATNKVLCRVRSEWWKTPVAPTLRLEYARLANTTIYCNSVALGELLKNLVDNAIKHGKDPVTIVLSDRADQVIIQVSDRGNGINKDLRDQVFERFVKGPEARSGSGLGLAIVHQIIEAVGGEIRLTNRKSGGLMVEVRLPRWPSARQKHGH